jgi:hypothetical protein
VDALETAACGGARCWSSKAAGEKLPSGVVGGAVALAASARVPSAAAPPAAADVRLVMNRRLEEAIAQSFLSWSRSRHQPYCIAASGTVLFYTPPYQ